jgi:hypothetical protein
LLKALSTTEGEHNRPIRADQHTHSHHTIHHRPNSKLTNRDVFAAGVSDVRHHEYNLPPTSPDLHKKMLLKVLFNKDESTFNKDISYLTTPDRISVKVNAIGIQSLSVPEHSNERLQPL